MQPGSFATAFVWAVLPGLVLLLCLYAIDRYEKEPIRLVAIAVLFGAVLAPAITVAIQTVLGVPTSMVVQTVVPASRLNLTTPVVEGVVLGLTIAVVCWLVRGEIDGLLDGVIYGAAVAIGFGMTATFVAIIRTPSLGQSVTPSLFSAMVAGLNVVLYGGVVGLAIAAVRTRGAGAFALAALVGTAVTTTLLVLHDYIPSWVGSPASDASGSTFRAFLTGLPNLLGLAALVVLAVWSASRDQSIVTRQLRDEVATGLVTAEDYGVVTHPFKRAGALLSALVRRGATAWRILRGLYATEVELAYAKQRSDQDGHAGPASGEPASGDEGRVSALRARIAQAQQALVAAGGRTT